MFHQINRLQAVLNSLLDQERDNAKAEFKKVLRELVSQVEEFPEHLSFSSFIQEECAMRNTYREPIEKEFWRMGLSADYDKCWKVVERADDLTFCYSGDGGIRAVDASKFQLSLTGVGCC